MIALLKRIALQYLPVLLLPAGVLAAQTDTVEVARITVKVPAKGAEELHYAFAAGDRILFDFVELDGKEVTGFSVLEYPDQPRVKEVKTAGVFGGVLTAPRTAVYVFRMENNQLLAGRTCALHLRRIPAGPVTRYFNTSVRWEEQYDTLIVNSGKNIELTTETVTRRRRVLTHADTTVLSLLERTERVRSRANLTRPSTSSVEVVLPEPLAEPNAREPYLTSEVVAWSYWLGVGAEAKAEFEKANQLARMARKAAGAAEVIGLISGGYGALVALAIEGVSYFALPAQGDNVQYRILQGEAFIEGGDGPAAFARLTSPRRGRIRFELTNDNYVEAIDVNLRVVAVIVTRHYQEEIFREEQEVPVVERVVRLKRVPVVGN